MTKNEIDIDEIIQEKWKPHESSFNGKYNKTSLFLLNMIELNIRERLVAKYFVNAYLDDKEYEHDLVRPLFVLFKVTDVFSREWIEFTKVIRYKEPLAKHLILDYNVGKEDKADLIMFVFRIPDRWKEDYYHFKAGRYSKFSEIYKKLFPKDVKGSDGKLTESIVWGAMYKSANLKNMVAKKLTPCDNKGVILDEVGYKEIRSILDKVDEIWDAPRRDEEYYRYKTKEHEQDN